MKKTRLLRISCFEPGVPLSGQCARHFAPRTAERAAFIFDREKKCIPAKYDRVILHQGNLKRDSYRVLRTADRVWTRADELASRRTAFRDFDELLNAKGNFYPSLRTDLPECKELADLYDEAQQKRNDPRRAHRYSV